MTRKTMYTAPRVELLSFAAERVITDSGYPSTIEDGEWGTAIID